MYFKYLKMQEWNSLIQHYSNTTPFHNIDWLTILSETWPEIEIYFLSIHENGEGVGLLPVILKKRFGLKFLGSPLRGYFTPYLGPLIKDPSRFNYLALRRCLIEEFSPDFLEISLQTGSSSFGDLESKSTIIVDLSKDEDALWKGFKKNTRNQVRQATKRGVQVFSPTEAGSWISVYYDMVTNTFRKQDLPNPAPIDFYERCWTSLYPKGMLKVFLARYEDDIIAGSFYVLWQGIIYGFDGASYPQYHKLRANNLIEWETISWGAQAGFKVYDMLGANIPSIAKFKLGFGGNMTDYQYFAIQPTIIGKFAWKIYKRFRKNIKRISTI